VTVAGQTFTLTTGADALTLTAGNDTVTGSAGTVGTTDSILDSADDDSDVLNVSANATAKPTVTNVEAINVDWTTNATIAFDLGNVSGGSLVSFTNDTLAFAGTGTIAGTGFNNLNFDSAITGLLTVNGVIESEIDAGTAGSLTLAKGTHPQAAGKTKADVTFNKATISALTNDVEELTISSSVADAKITITAGDIIDKLTVTGDNSVTVTTDLMTTDEKIYNELADGKTLTVVSNVGSGTLDFSNVNADIIKQTAASGANNTTIKTGVNLVAGLANAFTTIVEAATSVDATANLSSSFGLSGLNVTGIKTMNLTATDNITVAITTDDNNEVNLLGAKNINLTQTAGTASIDASAMTGKLTYTGADVVSGIVGSSTAVNTLTMANTTTNSGVITGSGNDSISYDALTSGTTKITSGSGNDSIVFGTATVATGTVTVDAGAGTDSITLEKVDNIIGAKLTATGVEEFIVIDNAQFNETHLSGKSYKISAVTADDGIVVTVANSAGASTVTTDLSKLTFNTLANKNITDTTITGDGSKSDIITGSTVIDNINGDGGADTIDISNGGQDVITVTAGDSTEAKMDKISGFTANVVSAAKDGDTLTFSAGNQVMASAATAADATVVTNTSVISAISGGTGAETVTADLSSGFMVLAGADAGSIDTLAEWVDAATVLMDTAFTDVGDALAFKFGGNTYVYSVATVDGTDGDADDNVATFDLVELTGLTTATALSTTDALNTIHLG
jgi:hypothetical protein